MKIFRRRKLFLYASIPALIVLFSLRASALEMKAGAAKANITPHDPKGRVMVYGAKCRGVLHDIWARALTLNDGNKRLVIVTYDLNCLDVATPILRVRCRDELGIDPAYLVLMATHNHSAPIQIVPDNFEYGRWLADRIFELIKEAMKNEIGPVRLYFGSGQGKFLGAMSDHEPDTEIQVLKVMRGSETMAVLFNHPTHALQASMHRIEVGHPGFALDFIEKKMPGTMAMYADAAGANQMVMRGLMVYALPFQVKSVGRKLGRIVLDILDGPMRDITGPIKSRLEVISLPLAPPMPYEDAKKLAADKNVPLDIGFVPYPHPDRETNWIRALLEHYEQNMPFPKRTTDRVCTDDAFLVRKLPEPREFPCVYEETIVATIGPMVFVAMQGEVCAPIGLRIKDAFRDEMPIMLFAYMGEHNLYIPTRDLVEKDAYQSQVIRIQYASPVGWDPGVEDEMGDAVIKMIESMLGN
jgi:hypothetical protein